MAHGRDGAQVRRRCVGSAKEGLDLLVECGLAGVVEAEQDDGVFKSGPSEAFDGRCKGFVTMLAGRIEIQAFGEVVHDCYIELG